MKQIIPFKKELLFKTKVSEITSISLEHDIISKNDDMVSGKFVVSGDYKMTEGSINREYFSFDIPFDINLESSYDVDSVVLDIDNFYYEIVNNESLKVNIDVYLIGNKKDDIIKAKKEEVNILEEVRNNDDMVDINDKEVDYVDIKTVNYNKPDKLNDMSSEMDVDIANANDSDNTNINNNIFDTIDASDTYVTYYVYIVKEEDTIEKIIEKFNISPEELEKYNDISNIHEKDKLIIPNSVNE